MGTLPPRVVFVTRQSEYDYLLSRHATREQARFFLQSRGQSLDEVEARHRMQEEALAAAQNAVPDEWRKADIGRANLDRFLFAPEDIIVALGQDGLVPNVAKYLAGQPVIGINPDPDLYDGVLVRFAVDRLADLLVRTAAADIDFEDRTMVEGRLDSGERLVALNELFVGHRSHQSARYRIEVAGEGEEQSSSGIIVATGTGATGWARSIMAATGQDIALRPTQTALGWFVREPFPSVATGTSLRAGRLETGALSVTSHMNAGGTVFADGIEADHLAFDWGRRLEVRIAGQTLRLVAG